MPRPAGTYAAQDMFLPLSTALTQLSACDHAHMLAIVPIWSQTSATVGDKDPFV